MAELTKYYSVEEQKAMDEAFADLLSSSYQPLNPDEKAVIKKAYETAREAHKEQRRKSGEPYIFHPIAVAKIVASEIGLGPTSIVSALLHDTVEDTDITIDYLRREFGEKVAQIVDGLTKIKKLPKDSDLSIQAENFRKLILTINEDVRVILIKIADRLHNMQTMQSMPRHKQERIASETLYIYAPLAHRLGLYNIKTQLEDLSLKYTDPEMYHEIKTKLEQSAKDREDYIRKFKKIVEGRLKEEGFEFTIEGRPKSIYSIYKKMKKKGVRFEEVYDIFAIRIIYKSPDIKQEKKIAWNIFSVITDLFKYNSNRTRNWLDQPRSTGYQALHMTVLGPENKWVEVQIRSERMHEIAEKGYAAHYRYKEGKDETQEMGVDRWINQLRDILNNPQADTMDFLEDIRLDLYSEEIHVLTPKGDVVSLPKGATVLDFAFYIHTDVGLHTRAAEVNNRIVPLNYVLNSGDLVRIITSENQKPKYQWLNITKTGRARSKIKAFLRQEENEMVEEGKAVLQRKLRHLKMKYNDDTIQKLQKYFKLGTSRELFYKVGTGEITNENLKAFSSSQGLFANLFKSRWTKKSKVKSLEDTAPNYDMIVFGRDEQQFDYSLANCCNPLPGDEIFGFITINEGIKVHKKTCPNAIHLQSKYAHRIIRAVWKDSSQKEFKVRLRIRGADRPGIVADISRLVALDLKYDMRDIEFHDLNGVFEGEISVYLKNTSQLKELMLKLKEIEGVEKVEKI